MSRFPLFHGWHRTGCERATRAIGGVQSSMRETTVIVRYCDYPSSRVENSASGFFYKPYSVYIYHYQSFFKTNVADGPLCWFSTWFCEGSKIQGSHVELFIGSKVLFQFCFEIFTPEGRGGGKGGSANFKTKRTEPLTL